MRLGTGVSTGSQSALPQTQNWPTTDPGGAERDPPARAVSLPRLGRERSTAELRTRLHLAAAPHADNTGDTTPTRSTCFTRWHACRRPFNLPLDFYPVINLAFHFQLWAATSRNHNRALHTHAATNTKHQTRSIAQLRVVSRYHDSFFHIPLYPRDSRPGRLYCHPTTELAP